MKYKDMKKVSYGFRKKIQKFAKIGLRYHGEYFK